MVNCGKLQIVVVTRSTEVVTNTPPHDFWNRPSVIREVIDQVTPRANPCE